MSKAEPPLGPRNIEGPPVTGEDFFDRERFVSDIEDALLRGSVAVLGPRR